MRRIIALIAISLIVTACGSQYERSLGRLVWVVGWGQIGSSADVWLVKHNYFGEWEKVALVFGYMDDYAFCTEVAQMYVTRYPSDRYTCQLAN